MADDYKEKRRQEWEQKQKELFEEMMSKKDGIKEVNINDNIYLSKTGNSYRVKANDNFYFYIPKSALPENLTYDQINGAKITDLKLEKSENGDYIVMKDGKITGADGKAIKFEFKGEDIKNNASNKNEEKKTDLSGLSKKIFGKDTKPKGTAQRGQAIAGHAGRLIVDPHLQPADVLKSTGAIAGHTAMLIAKPASSVLANAFKAAFTKKTGDANTPLTAASNVIKPKMIN